LVGTASAQAPFTAAEIPESAYAEARAEQFKELVQPGKDTREAFKKVRRLGWTRSLRSARSLAKLQDKPILWIEAYGEITGYV